MLYPRMIMIKLITILFIHIATESENTDNVVLTIHNEVGIEWANHQMVLLKDMNCRLSPEGNKEEKPLLFLLKDKVGMAGTRSIQQDLWG
jgi:hypothetical protein